MHNSGSSGFNESIVHFPLSTNRHLDRDNIARLWQSLPTIPGEPPHQSRLCKGFRVDACEYQKTSQCGWFMERGEIIPFLSTRC